MKVNIIHKKEKKLLDLKEKLSSERNKEVEKETELMTTIEKINEEIELNKELNKIFEEKFDLYSNYVDQGIINEKEKEKISLEMEEKRNISREIKEVKELNQEIMKKLEESKELSNDPFIIKLMNLSETLDFYVVDFKKKGELLVFYCKVKNTYGNLILFELIVDEERYSINFIKFQYKNEYLEEIADFSIKNNDITFLIQEIKLIDF
jgi:primosomal protein N'